MPAINAAASPAPVANALPPASDGVTAASAQAADGQGSATPFAAVLKRQMGDPATATPPVVKPDVELAAVAEALQEPMDLAAILPTLMSLAGKGPATTSDAENLVPADGKGLPGEDPDDGTALPELLLALPATTMVPQGSTATPAADGTAKAAAMPAASSPAILAAAPEVLTAAAAEAAPNESFEALLAGGREINPAAQGQAQAATMTSHELPAAARIETPVGAQGWDAEVGDRLVWMAGRHDSRAELVLTPPQLGRIEISLSMSGDQATATFVSASPAVREALENALPRLREILADAGVTLGQAQVGSDSPGQSASGRENGDNPPQKAIGAFGATVIAPVAAGSTGPWLSSGRGMVDVFA